MPETLVELLDKTDLAVASCREAVNEQDVDRLAQVARDVRRRLSYSDDLIVVALAGGTGSGKSSIFNLVAGVEVSDVGGVRPTTSSPLAVVPQDREDVIGGFLSELGIDFRTVPDLPEWLVLIDLPDTDSVQVEHRFQVEALLPSVDMVVWVTDPEKYRDAVFHDKFLKPLRGYEDQMFFVINQIDRVGGVAIDELVEDLAAALIEDGFHHHRIFPSAAAPTFGPPHGIDDLLAALESSAPGRSEIHAKLTTDLYRAVAVMQSLVGDSGVDFDRRSADVIEAASPLIVDGGGDAALSMLTAFVEILAIETPGPLSEDIRKVAVGFPGVVQEARESLDAAVDQHRSGRPWFRWSEKGADMPRDARLRLVNQQLGSVLDSPLRQVLARRAKAQGSLADLSLSLAANAAFWPVTSTAP